MSGEESLQRQQPYRDRQKDLMRKLFTKRETEREREKQRERERFESEHIHTQHTYAGEYVDFQRHSSNTLLLSDFMSEVDLLAADLPFRSSIQFTYERDDGLSRSWIDHIICSQSCSTLVIDVSAIHSGCNLSDHSPLYFLLNIECQSLPRANSSAYSPSPSHTHARICWSKTTPTDVENYCVLLSQHLPTLPTEVTNCSDPNCLSHLPVLDAYAEKLVSALISCSLQCFPCVSSSKAKSLPGWTGGAGFLKRASCFWHKVWVEAGCGVLSQIKRNAKSRFKYAVRRLRRRKDHVIRDKFVHSFAPGKGSQFWHTVKQFNRVNRSSSPVIDGVSENSFICNIFSSKYENLLNKHPSGSESVPLSTINSLLSSCLLSAVDFLGSDVIKAIGKLKSGKCDSLGVCSEHLKLSSSLIALPLSLYFSSVVRHGYMPKLLSDSVLVPVPKSSKDSTVSSNYRPVALCSTLSKVLEHLILESYGDRAVTCNLASNLVAPQHTVLVW